MILIKIILWVVGTLGVSAFLYFWFMPFIKIKFMLWLCSRQLRKMAKKYDGELGQELKDIADDMSKVSRKFTLDDLDDDEDDEDKGSGIGKLKRSSVITNKNKK